MPNGGFVWIVGYPDGVSKVCKTWQQPSWFRDRCAKLGIERSVHSRGTRSELRILGIACVEPGTIFTGPLASLTREESLLFEYHGRPLDFLSLRVVSVAALPQSDQVGVTTCSTLHASMISRCRNSRRFGEQAVYTCGHPCAYPVEDLVAASPTIAAWLRNCRDADPDLPEPLGSDVLMVQMPLQVGELIMARAWHTIGIRGTWFAPRMRRGNVADAAQVFPTPRWPSESFWSTLSDQRAPAPEWADFTATSLVSLADDLRGVAKRLAPEIDGDDGLGDRDILAAAVTVLEGLGISLGGGGDGDEGSTASAHPFRRWNFGRKDSSQRKLVLRISVRLDSTVSRTERLLVLGFSGIRLHQPSGRVRPSRLSLETEVHGPTCRTTAAHEALCYSPSTSLLDRGVAMPRQNSWSSSNHSACAAIMLARDSRTRAGAVFDSMPVPSKSSVQKWVMDFDVAAMLAQRSIVHNLIKTGITCWWGADSSPQHGQDWFMAAYSWAANADVPLIRSAAIELMSLGEEDVDARKPHVLQVQKLRLHRLPALALGDASLSKKMEVGSEEST